MKTNPPKWADRFLRWYCNPDLLEEIQGDIYEIFDRTIAVGKTKYAKVKFIWDVFRFFRWSNIKRSRTTTNYNNTGMITNYLKTGFRNIIKDRVTSVINIAGLSLAIGCAITTYIFADYMLHQDAYHSNKDNIYQLINIVDNSNERELWSDTPLLLGEELKEKISFIDQLARVEYSSGNFRYEDLVFNERIWFSDPEILEMFDFPIAEGDRKVLHNKEQIYLSRNAAIKYFGDTDAVGQQVSIKYDNGKIQSYFVGGIFEEWPSRTSFAPNVLISIDNFYSLTPEKEYGWSYLTDGLFLTLDKGHDPIELQAFFEDWVELQNDSDPEFKTVDFELIPFTDLPARNYEISSALVGGGHPAGIIGLSVISILLILLACFNYVNIAISSSVKRLKEIGLRKVMGGTKGGIVRQFLVENTLTCLFAVILGIVLSYFLLLPGFNQLIPVEMPFEFTSSVHVIALITGLLVFTGVVSGAYPAFYISKFNPVDIFRGSQKFGHKSFFSKVLLTLQFIIAFSTVVGSFIFTDASMQFVDKDWGYNPKDVVTIPVANQEQRVGLKNILSQNSQVLDIVSSYGQIAAYDRITTIQIQDEIVQSYMYGVEPNYGELLGFDLLEGRFIVSSSDEGVAVVNERMVKDMGWNQPLEQHFYFDSVRYDVVGVIKNLVTHSPFNKPLPSFFISQPEDSFNYLSIKASDGNEVDVFQSSKEAWKKVAPDDPFEGFYQSQVMDSFYQENEANITIMLFVSSVALILACIGLYGLVSFNINRRMKEFSVRKVLGASIFTITKHVNGDYIWIVLIAFFVGAPLGYLQIIQLLKSIYPDTPSVGNMPFIIALAVILVALLFTITSQIVKISKSNPADKLRGE